MSLLLRRRFTARIALSGLRRLRILLSRHRLRRFGALKGWDLEGQWFDDVHENEWNAIMEKKFANYFEMRSAGNTVCSNSDLVEIQLF